MISPVSLPDESQRARVRTSTASLAVEASAGTGKTYLLVVRALWLILARRIPADALVALAFGEQAATELKERLRAKLEEIAGTTARDALDPEVLALAPNEPLDALRARASAALEALDRAHVSTIHAFASTLLRLHPAEAGVDPGFEVVEDAGEAEAVRDEWSRFVAEELGADATRRDAWLGMLARVRLRDLYELGAALAGYDTDLAALPSAPTLSEATARWFTETATMSEALHEEIREGKKTARAGLAGFAHALRTIAARGRNALLTHRDALAAAAKLTRSHLHEGLLVKSWHDFEAIKQAATHLLNVEGEETIFAAVDLLRPFALRVRARLKREGKLTYAGLLALARDLLRDHPEVRRRLNARFRAILLDEAQDVDPVQLELILLLAERPGEAAKSWREVLLEPGKLFLVGDPKQSIYLFRGADVRAFRAVLQLMGKQGAETLTPTTSMRSAQTVLDAVNAVGAGIFTSYPALAERPGRAASRTGAAAEVLTVEPEEGEDAEAVEAAAVAARVKALLTGGLEPADIAVLFRKRGPMPVFAAALRAVGLEAAIEQERRFFLRQEVMDLINVTRLLADPADRVALAGVLRGPYGGLTDVELETAFAGFDPATLFGGAFPELRRDLFVLPAADWAERLYRGLGAETVASAAADPSARDAVRGFRRLLVETLDRHGLPRTLELLEECVRVEGDARDGGLPPLQPPPRSAAATPNAVRFLTVHNAKGLEFPAVLLAAIDDRPAPRRSTDTAVLRDWAGGVHGVALRALGAREAAATLDGCRLRAQRAREERDETARLVYVALTRARDRLIVVDRRPINGKKPGRTADTFRPHLAPLIEYPNSPASRSTSPVRRAKAVEAAGPVRSLAVAGPVEGVRPDLTSESEVISPTDLDERLRDASDDAGALPAGTRRARAWLGELCHEVLRAWDFAAHPSEAVIGTAVDEAQTRIGGPRPLPPGLRQQALGLLYGFLRSAFARDLARAEILGREVPLLAEVDGRTISARADVVYRLDGRLIVGDYKLSSSARVPGEVSAVYAAAATLALREEAAFRVLPIEG